MELEKIFNDLESNQVQEWEDAKQKLVELFFQNKEQWVVQYMMEYFLKTGSLRIMEVLVKVQAPHDIYIFDRLDDWLKTHQFRVHALNLFCFIVRKHPTWLFKVDKHRLIKNIIKLLMTEREIVPLMSALLCIITLLPIIPSLVPNFLGELFEVFGHLASWNAQNPNRLPEDKLVHLQLGLQMLFHRLYGMFPCNFLAYLSDFIKKERTAIFQHTIQPLLETVRVHPMLITATSESEVSSARWKEMEPHDVVMDCVRVTLPVVYQDFNAEFSHCRTSSARSTPGITFTRTNSNNNTTSGGGIITNSENFTYEIRDVYQRFAPISRFDGGGTDLARASALWSPFNEIVASGPIPLTPTPSYHLPLTTTPNILHNQLMAQAGSSPPEAAVEATPETTPMKIGKDFKAQSDNPPLAVRAIFATTSNEGNRKNPANFPPTGAAEYGPSGVGGLSAAASGVNLIEQGSTRVLARYTTTTTTTTMLHHDRRMQQVRQERTQSQSPFQTIDALNAKREHQRNSLTPGSNSELTDASPTLYVHQLQQLHNTYTPTSTTVSSPIPTPTAATPVDNLHMLCDNSNDTETESLCSAGGLHTPTSRSIELVAKGIKRRNRMASYCYNESTHAHNKIHNEAVLRDNGIKMRRTKSCFTLGSDNTASSSSSSLNVEPKEDQNTQLTIGFGERRLQKSNKMLSIAKVKTKNSTTKTAASKYLVNVETQTLQREPQNYENLLFTILQKTDEKREEFERQRYHRNPQEILNRYVNSCWMRDNFENIPNYRVDQEQYQLLCLQLQYERYRREIHAERNRRLMGRSRDRRSLEMERDRLREQHQNIAAKDKELILQMDNIIAEGNDKEQNYLNELNTLKLKYQYELDQNKCLRQANENLQKRLTDEINRNRDFNNELEALRADIFNMTSELVNAQQQADIGNLCKQELARLEAEFIVMGEVQIKCRDRLAQMEHLNSRSDELQMMQDASNIELKEVKHLLEERTAQLDGAKHKLVELQIQLTNSEKVITEQKRLLKAVKDEYEEKFKALNRKYDVQKIIILKMEEKLVMSLNKSLPVYSAQPCSPDTDRTDIASSIERNSPLSTSLASSESLSASLRSTAAELRNLQQLIEPTLTESSASNLMFEGSRSTADMGASSTINIVPRNTANTMNADSSNPMQHK